MKREYALRFEPADGGSVVPGNEYVAALAAAVEALTSTRAVVAPALADAGRWPLAHVKECLAVGFAPPARGSLVAPVVIGARSADLDGARLAAIYWRTTGRMVSGAARAQPTQCELTSTGADAFAKAAGAARAGGANLRLVSRQAGAEAWTTSVDLTAVETQLREYAGRRQASNRARSQLVGTLATLSSEPLSVTLVTATGRRLVRLPGELRDAAHACWGAEVILDVEASISMEGDVREPRALAIRAVPRVDDAFMLARGSAKDVWSGEDARDYLDGLRGREHS